MAQSNPIIQYSTGGKASATFSGDLGGGYVIRDSRIASGSLRTPTITTIGAKLGTLAAGASVNINLYDGSLLALDGAITVPLRQLLYVEVSLTSDSAGGYLRVGNASADTHLLWFGGATHTADVMPGGPCFVQGDPTTALAVDGTHKVVKILNPHATLAATYVFRCAGLLV